MPDRPAASRRDLLKYTAAAAASLAFPRSGRADPPAERQNILFIICDDLNVCLSAYGQTEIKSANVDRLARRGVQFDRMYCQYPQCAPNRTVLLTGLRPDSTHVLDNFTNPQTVPTLKDRVLIPEYFARHGYATAAAGKIAHWENYVKWDRYLGVNEGSGNGAPEEQRKYKSNAANLPDEKMPDNQTARQIANLLKQPHDKPFFIAAGFHKPHTPLICPKPYFDLYDPKRFSLLEPPPGYGKDLPPAALETSLEGHPPGADRRSAVWAYYACISFVDAQIGIVLDALEQAKLTDNTIVVLTADHGFLLGEHGRFGKQSLFEQAARIPLIIAAPGKPAGVHCQRLVESVDLYATLADLAGLPTPPDMQGTSFAPLLANPSRAWKSAVFTITARSSEGGVRKKGSAGDLLGRSIRTDRYVYNDWGSEGFELYDHQTDPHEYTSLAHDPAHASIAADLHQRLQAGWRAAVPT